MIAEKHKVSFCFQRESRAARDVASCSAAQAAGAEASQQDLQHLQGCLPVLTPCLMAYIPDSCRHFSCLTLCLNSCLQQLQVCSMSPPYSALTCHHLTLMLSLEGDCCYEQARLCFPKP